MKKKMLHSTKRSGNFILFFKHYIKYSLSESQTPVQENVQGRLYLPQSLSKDALQGRGWEAMSWGFGWLSLWGERAHTHGRCCLQSRMEWLWCLEATASQPASLPSELCMPLFLPSRWSPSLTNTGRKLDLKHRALEHGCLGILFLKNPDNCARVCNPTAWQGLFAQSHMGVTENGWHLISKGRKRGLPALPFSHPRIISVAVGLGSMVFAA